MRTRVAVIGVAAALVSASVSAASPTRITPRLVPEAVVFSSRTHGVLGFGSANCNGCRARGALAITADGGKTWVVVLRTSRRVVAIAFFHDAFQARLDDGHVLWADTAARSWHRSRSRLRHLFEGHCPKGWRAGVTANLVDTNIDRPWSICTLPPGSGNQAKAVYRGTKRVAFTPLASHGGYGGISVYGYPVGIAGSRGGFGIIWETRGTLYVTRDGGYHWHALPRVARPELDSSSWASVLQGNVGFVILERGGHSRLIETTDAGRTWRVVHRWR